MLSSFLEYISPTNPIATVIVRILQYAFLSWFIGLLIYAVFQLIRYIQIKKNQNVQMLVDAQKEKDVESKNNDQKPDPENVFREFCKKDIPNDGYPIIKEIKASFFSGSFGKRSPIAKHLKAIFLAGWNESRLEVGELINHTTSNLFKWNNIFRSVLAVFIIIGLLGTLFGLTDSLTELSPALNKDTTNDTPTDNTNGMTKVLSELFETIKGAFAPSILGIIFTILGVIIYGTFLRSACHPIKSILEQVTLTIWIPQLYPTTSQRLIQTLHESEAQMRSGYQTAAQVGELVENVQCNISEFNENLKLANAITKPLSDSASQINAAASQINSAADVLNKGFTESLGQFSQEFAENVTRLTGFQNEIRTLHQDFQNAANQKLDQQDQKLDEQTQHIINVLNTLKSYEAAYIKSREQIDETLQKFINEATEANTSIHERNREWYQELNTDIQNRNREWFQKLNADNQEKFSGLQDQFNEKLNNLQQTMENELKTISEALTENLTNVQGVLDKQLETLTNRLENFDTPLKEVVEESRRSFDKQLETLNDHLSDFDQPLRETVDQIKQTFDEQLGTLNNRLETFDVPLKESADKMSGTFANLVKHMQTIVGDLQKEIKEQNEQYEEQLTSVKNLNQSVKNLLTQLDESSKNQKEAVDTLSTNIGGLTADINNLDSAIKTFTSDSGDLSQSVGTIKGDIQKLGTASQQFVEKVGKADVTPLTASIEKLNTSVNAISQHSQTLANAVNTLGKREHSTGVGRKLKSSYRGGKWNPLNWKKTSGQPSESQTNNEGE